MRKELQQPLAGNISEWNLDSTEKSPSIGPGGERTQEVCPIRGSKESECGRISGKETSRRPRVFNRENKMQRDRTSEVIPFPIWKGKP